jgi:enoyl-CoA hydratase/carnithine racemase
VADSEIVSVQNGPVQIISWKREKQRNAFTSQLALGLKQAVKEAGDDQSIGVIFLDPGNTVFSSGWDLNEIHEARSAGVVKSSSLVESGRLCLNEISKSPCFVVSVCRGAALGFGISILSNSDFVLAQSSAKIALPELDSGVIPSTVLGDLTAKVGNSRALSWSIFGSISKSDALNSGLVNSFIPDDEIDAEIESYVSRFSKVGVSSLRSLVALAREMGNLSGEEAKMKGDDFTKSSLSIGELENN